MANIYALRNGKGGIKPVDLPKLFEETNRKLEEEGAKLIRWTLDRKILWIWFGHSTIYMFGITEEGAMRTDVPHSTIRLAEEDPRTEDAVIAAIEAEEGLIR